MLALSKSYEDSFLKTGACSNAQNCKGVTARTVHGRALGAPLRPFVLPDGRKFADRCLLCIRASVSERWYEVLYRGEFPEEPIHEWTVLVDAEGEYDAAVCVGPCDADPESPKSRYVGVVGPFPRYDETTLLVVEDGFEQMGVEYKTVPRYMKPNERVRARPLGFHEAFRTQFALILAGFVCDVSDRDIAKIPLVNLYNRCLPGKHHTTSNAKWYSDAALKLASWFAGVVRIGTLGLYPHCKEHGTTPPTDARYTLFFVREHITFLVERDSPELWRAVARAHPDWERFVTEVRSLCDAVRKSGSTNRSVPNGAKRTAPGFAPAPEDRFGSRRVVDPKNRTKIAVSWYACTSCGEFKSDTECGGCVDVCVDLETGVVRCHKKRAVGRKPTQNFIERNGSSSFVPAGCSGVVSPMAFGDRVVNFNWNSFVACAVCAKRLVPVDWVRTLYGYACDGCRTERVDPRCETCGTRCSKDGFKIRAFKKGEDVKDVWFCRSHARRTIRNHADVWSYDLLMEAVCDTKRVRR